MFSRDDILQHRLVERQVSDQPLELGLLIFELAQTPHLRRHQPRIKLLPPIKRLLRNPYPTGHLSDRRAGHRLLQHVRNLLLGVPRLIHGLLLLIGGHTAGKLSLKPQEGNGRTSNARATRPGIRCGNNGNPKARWGVGISRSQSLISDLLRPKAFGFVKGIPGAAGRAD